MENDRARRAKRKPTGDYEVGYCKPPAEHQFGRRKNPVRKNEISEEGDNNSSSIALFRSFEKMLNRKVPIVENGRRRTVAYRDFVVMRYGQLSLDSFKGLSDFMKMAEKVDRASLEGGSGEPIRIIIEGGLPDGDDYWRWLKEKEAKAASPGDNEDPPATQGDGSDN